MSTLRVILLVAFCSTIGAAFSQDFKMEWTEKVSYTNKKEGFFTQFINTNEDYVYVLNANLALRPTKKDDKMKLIAYNKSTMKKVGNVALRGYKENASKKATYKDLDYLKTVIFKEKVMVFWVKKSNAKSSKKEELYVESFTAELKRDDKLKKIYTRNIPSDVRTSRFASSAIVVLENKEAGENLIIGSEIPNKGDNVEFTFVEMDNELEVSEEFKIELPIETPSKSYGLTSDYFYGKDGNVYVSSIISLTKEERKKQAKGADWSYCVLSIINTKSGDVEAFEIRDKNKTINDFQFVVSDKEVKVYGFFGDLQKDASGNSTHGIFYSTINSASLEGDGINYTYFDKSTIDKLFAKDKEDKKKTAALSKKKKQAAKANDQSALDIRFGIESIFVTPENDVVLFCSKMYNYSVTTCTSSPNGGTQCTTRYYCQKSNVTALRVSTEGEIVWASNVDRMITYGGTSIKDLRVAYKNDKYYVIYGSQFKLETNSKGKKSRKKNSEARDNFEYATFEAETGKFKKNNFLVNSKSVEKKERKLVNPLSITVLDDNFYVNYMVIRQQVGWCVANVICFPTLYYSMLSGNTKKGTGNLGVIKIIK